MRRLRAVVVAAMLSAFQSNSAVGASRVYFTDPGFGDQVSRVNLDGSDLDVVAAFPSIVDPRALAIDGVNGQAYYSSGSVLQRVAFDGTGLESLGPSGGSVPTDIALDVAGDRMYWSVDGTAGVKRSALNGTAPACYAVTLKLAGGVDPLVRADAVSGIAPISRAGGSTDQRPPSDSMPCRAWLRQATRCINSNCLVLVISTS
jgi:hypothetical protein